MVKADAYGHGAASVCKKIAPHCKMFAAATADEALQVKRECPRSGVLMLMPPCQKDADALVAADAALTVFSAEHLRIVSAACSRLGKQARVHIKFDSGMNRLGCSGQDLGALISLLDGQRQIVAEGLYTHFGSTHPRDIRRSVQRFDGAAAAVKSRWPDVLPHACASSTAMGEYRNRYDMVRCGLALYGYGKQGLTPAMEVAAGVLEVKRVQRGNFIGYGRTFRARRDMDIAIIGCGYADGLPRLISPGGAAEIGGRLCAFAGSVCMDMTAADVSGTDVCAGAEAVIMSSRRGNERLSFEYNARHLSTIPYELLTGFNRSRNVRQYI